MLENISKLNIVRVGSHMSFSSLKRIGDGIPASFLGMIDQFDVSHHNAPVINSIDAQLLTMVLHQEYGGHTLALPTPT